MMNKQMSLLQEAHKAVFGNTDCLNYNILAVHGIAMYLNSPMYVFCRSNHKQRKAQQRLGYHAWVNKHFNGVFKNFRRVCYVSNNVFLRNSQISL